MHIVIMGCGRVGSMLAVALEAREHSVAVIDSNPDSFRRLGPGFGGETVPGYGFDRDVLTQAGIGHADGFAAVSSGDNSNIIAARVAREQFNVDNVVARIYDPGRAEVFERLGIPTVATVPWAADSVLRRLVPAGSEPAWRDQSGEVRLDSIFAPASWVGQRIEALEAATRARVGYLRRLGVGMIASGNTIIQDGDFLSIFMLDEDAASIHETIAAGPQEAS